MAGLLDTITEAYMRNVGNPARQLVGGGVRGLLGLDAPEYADTLGMEAYRNAAALGNAPGINAPVGAFKAAAKVVPEAAMFIGALAKTWDKASNAKALQMEKAGKDARDIWRETGNLRGPDGKWRQEIDDSSTSLQKYMTPDVKVNSAGEWFAAPAGDLMPHSALTAAYPEMSGLSVTMKSYGKGGGGHYREGSGVVLDNAFTRQPTYKADRLPFPVSEAEAARMNSENAALGTHRVSNPEDARSTMLHELQHAIQQREGFARGGSMDDFMRESMQAKQKAWDRITSINEELRSASGTPRYQELLQERQKLVPLAQKDTLDLKDEAYQAYRRLAGEAEARATQTRMNMSPAERRAMFPYDSYDVPMDQLIVRGLLGP